MINRETEVTLTGSDSSVEGTVKPVIFDGYAGAWEFLSLDESLHLIIGKDTTGQWARLAGSEPYLSGWVDELAEQIELINT